MVGLASPFLEADASCMAGSRRMPVGDHALARATPRFRPVIPSAFARARRRDRHAECTQLY
jgi:hypothetical protein